MNPQHTSTPTPSSADVLVCNSARTAELLNFADLVDAIAKASIEYEAQAILSPTRMVVPIGADGVLLSMPATASDIAIHKLVNVQPGNAKRGLPTIHGLVSVCDTLTGRPLCILDGPQVTGRRTAAVSLLAIRALLGHDPKQVLIFGTGAQASHHVHALHAMYPDCKIWVQGLDEQQAQAFCQRHAAVHALISPRAGAVPEEVDVVITLTTSTEPVYNEIAKPGRLVIGVGAFKPEMAEIGKTTLDGSALYADDPVGAQHEAGDLLRAGVDWSRVKSLGSLISEGRGVAGPVVFKSVGTAAWDLAAARVALKNLGSIAP